MVTSLYNGCVDLKIDQVASVVSSFASGVSSPPERYRQKGVST